MIDPFLLCDSFILISFVMMLVIKEKGCRRETRMAEMKEQIHRAVGSYIAPISLSDFIYSCFIAGESEAHKRCYDVSYLAGGNQSGLSNPGNP